MRVASRLNPDLSRTYAFSGRKIQQDDFPKNLPRGRTVVTRSYRTLIRRVAVVGAALAAMVAFAQPAMAQTTTTTTVNGTPNPAAPNQPVTLTATVNCPGAPAGEPAGTVQFFDGVNTINGAIPVNTSFPGGGSGTATVTTSFATTGTHQITATYTPTGTACLGSTSMAFPEQVQTLATTVSVNGSPNPATPGQTVTLTATVNCTGAPPGEPAGSVVFSDGGVPISGSVAVTPAGGGTGTATFMTSFATTGTHPITAAYTPGPGSPCSPADNTANPFNEQVQTLATTVSVNGSPNPAAPNQAVTLTATVTCTGGGAGEPAGTVQFFDGG
ncbi:Ig-like domain-containing protein, partial [Gandjariella thermophila]|uniref:Ig-like domain-containing protein n=1 Tax=Gandjariella thermophila TaxID=1931992 RepID=UPI0010F7FC9A